jgi:two-component system, OmpR family, sensor histidine kinase CiaH
LIIFIILSFITYFISYFLAKITIEPIEENNKKLKEYNHNLAHEIKTPLAVINSNLELLELSYDRNLISSSKEEIASMVDITDSLLFLSENNELKEKEKINTLELLEKYL